MPLRSLQSWLGPAAAALKRAVRFATYDWTREMPLSRRVITIGELVYVNAGHNPPIVWGPWPARFLESTGTALGWFDDMTYDAGRFVIPPDGGLLMFTDGLPDSIAGDTPEDSLCRALDSDLPRTMANLKALVDPRFNEDDVTVLLVKRTVASPL